jgi:ribosomal protein S18 acetylase RimI-like enzyme
MKEAINKISYFDERNKRYYLKKIVAFLENVESDYPRHDEWIQMVSKNILQGENDRDILFTLNESDISSCAILKTGVDEKKICTLRVGFDFRNQGIATALVAHSIYELRTQLPLISVPSNKLHLYYGLLTRFGFTINSQYKDKYKVGNIEYVFNGFLKKETLLDIENKICFIDNTKLVKSLRIPNFQ